MVEIEIGVMRASAWTPESTTQIGPAAKSTHRNENETLLAFTTDKARAKMGRAYPVTSKES
jgi:hypothetical protein